MARHASTYRQERRAAWKLSGVPWADFNAREQQAADREDRKRFGNVRIRKSYTPAGRSKYMPHIGAKQIAKAAS